MIRSSDSRSWLLCSLVLVLFAGSCFGQQCDQIANEDRFDCYPEYGANQAGCIKRGCCWRPTSVQAGDAAKHLNRSRLGMDVPYCYFPSDFPNYQVVSKSHLGGSKDGLVLSLQKTKATFRPNEILKLEVRIQFETNQRLHVQILDPNNERYQVPLININQPYQKSKYTDKDNSTDYQISITNQPFSLRIYRKSTGKLLFDTSVAPLIYADQYIQFSSSLVNHIVYGLGEHRDYLAHQTSWRSFTFWTHDISPTINTNLYGVHPFYMSVENDGNSHGFFLLNSNAMDVNLQPAPAITFITIGGIIDFYLFLGPKPEDVVAQYTDVIGKPFMPSYFTLGFHLCRWRYDNDTKLAEVIKRNRAIQIPYDVQWTDIDGMDSKRDWTYDGGNFKNLPNIVEDLHNHGQHYINIIDPAISNTKGYAPYEDGLANNVFIKPYNSDAPLVGKVWPGDTVFPDFTNPNSSLWWTSQASKFHDQIPFDGIWIDMNEPSNFVDGSNLGCSQNSLDMPPYTPRVMGNALDSRTVCPSARQYISSHYNLHNMYGHFEAIATNNALRIIKPNKRPFVLSRSSFAGTGQFSAHWSGDNRATWDDLFYSIPVMLEFNMFGITMVGSDICGFSADTTEELCVRWMQLGAFYPFMRNHNDGGSTDQDPAVFSKQAQDIMRTALNVRYTVMPYLYTAFYRSHIEGHTVVKPLFFEFPEDPATATIDRQFLFGNALLITPVLEQGATSVKAYFPNDTWYDYYTGALVNSTKQYTVLDAPLDTINVHVRGGHIIPTQYPALTTTASRLNPFALIVALKYGASGNKNEDGFASGHLFWDDGESLDSISKSNYNLFDLNVQQGNLMITRVESGFNSTMILSEVKVFGVKEEPKYVTINDQSYNNFTFDDYNMVLKIQYFYIDLNQYKAVNITWSN